MSIPEVDKLTAREQTRYLLYLYTQDIMTSTWAPPNRADLLKTTLMNINTAVQEQLTPGLSSLVNRTYISDKRLRWISKSDQRQLIFLLLYVTHYYWPHPALYQGDAYQATLEPHHHATLPVYQTVNFRMPELLHHLAPAPELRREAFIAALDLSSERTDEKQRFIDDLQAHRASVMVNDRQLSWFNPNNPRQAQWARDLLHKSHPKPYFYCPAIANQATAQDISSEFLAKLDMIGTEHPSEQKWVLNQIRKAWSVHKSRKSPNAKKPASFTLSKEALRCLDKLQKETKRSRSDIIERLLIDADHPPKTSV